MPPLRPVLSFSAPGSRVTVSLAGSKGGGPKSCGGGGCDDDDDEEEDAEEAETIRSLFRRGRGRATTETATAAAAGAAGKQCGRRGAALRPATRKLALPVLDPPEVDAAAPLRARVAASGMGRTTRRKSEKRERDRRSSDKDERKSAKLSLSLLLLPLPLFGAMRLALPPEQKSRALTRRYAPRLKSRARARPNLPQEVAK